MPPVGAHLSEEWAEVEYGLQEGFVSTIEGDELVVHGECPRCHAQTAWNFRTGQMDEVSKAIADSVAAQETTILCACGYTHKNRPADANENGCGAYWPIKIPEVGQ